MRKVLAALCVVLFLTSFGVASAETQAGGASQRVAFEVPFTTYRVGDIHAAAVAATPKPNDAYAIAIVTPGWASFLCTANRSILLDGPGPVSCVASNAPAGDYIVAVWLLRGGGTRSLTVDYIGETTP
jgi:hypothetical protein